MPREDVVEVPAIGKGLCVSNVFQMNMVLQRDKPVTVWGWAAPGEKVAVAFAGKKAEAEAGKDRAWRVTLEAMPANATPQTMTVKGAKETLTLENILVGDVWVLGGQSNMAFPLSNINDGELEAVSANFPQIRLLTVPNGQGFESVASFQRLHEWSNWSKRHFRKGDWDVCTPELAREFSAIGYVFGRRLHMASRVPIGLIDVSVGGTTVEAWTPEAVLKEIPGAETQEMMKEWADRIAAYDAKADLENRIAAFQKRTEALKTKGQPIPADLKAPTDLRPGPIGDKNRPGCRYASMIRPLEGLSVAGVVFHQGYNNCFSGSAGARMYYQVFGKMITAWRRAFADDKLPLCVISLCTAGAPQTHESFLPPMYDVGPLVREAQYQTFVDFRKAGDKTIGFASSYDQRKSSYHPQIKVPVGERAAKWALTTRYELLRGEENWLPPEIADGKAADGRIVLTLSTTVQTRDDSDGKLLGFALAGDDRRFYPAQIDWYSDGTRDNRNRLQYKRNMLVLSSPFVPEPQHYRYAWARNPMGNIVNGRGIPLATQRSDEWLLEETPIKLPTPEGMDANSQRRYLSGRLQRELALADTERRIRESEATIAELKDQYAKDKAAWDKQKDAEAERAKAEDNR
ncbi:MAG TPA: sialate O-acetylesterase [Phycisphaerae bacterium]|nr:sialate O-acetylesterase [Phycisphaerae bacterium]